MRRPCLGCGTPVTRSRCPQCERTRDRLRGSRQQRGYDVAHDRARAALAATLPAPCGYGCGTWLTAGSGWVAAHVVDGDPDSPRVAACRSCNEKAKRRVLTA